MNYGDLLTLIAPETLLVVAALGVLVIDLTTLRGEPIAVRMCWGAWLAVLGCAAAGAALFLSPQITPAGYLDGMLVLSPLSPIVKGVLLVLTICTALISLETKFTEHAGEYFALLLLATVGMMFLVSTENTLLIFVSLELLSLCLYVMTAFNKQNIQSAEAALKYFLIGGVSAAFLLFGLSLAYGLTGELNLSKMAMKFAGAKLDPLHVVAMLMIVVGFGFKTSPVMAALANGTMGYACDVEPHHPEAILHPIAVMIPTALALGEPANGSGSDLLAAVVLGCEIEYRVSMALGPAEQYALGFHPSAVCGTFGATAAAAYLLKLDAEATGRALGLAACQASGMMAWESDPTENARPFQMGVAARNGVTSALLAQKGFGGPVDVFDRGHTVLHAFSRKSRPELLTRDLGAKFDGIAELAIKPYSCVSFLHPGLDALFGLIRDENIAPADIAALTLYFPQAGLHCVDGNPLKSHCAQYILPVAAIAGELRVADIFVDQRIANPAVAALAKRVTVHSHPELDRLFPDFYASIVKIETKNGRVVERRNDIARGYPESPLSASELTAKFDGLVASVASPAKHAELGAMLDTIESLPNCASLARVLANPR